MSETSQAVELVNNLHMQMAGVARSVVDALADKKMTAMETMMVTSQAMNLGLSLMLAVKGTTPAVRQAMLTVLESGRWTLDT